MTNKEEAHVVIPRSSNYPFDTPYIPPAEQERLKEKL